MFRLAAIITCTTLKSVVCTPLKKSGKLLFCGDESNLRPVSCFRFPRVTIQLTIANQYRVSLQIEKYYKTKHFYTISYLDALDNSSSLPHLLNITLKGHDHDSAQILLFFF